MQNIEANFKQGFLDFIYSSCLDFSKILVMLKDHLKKKICLNLKFYALLTNQNNNKAEKKERCQVPICENL